METPPHSEFTTAVYRQRREALTAYLDRHPASLEGDLPTDQQLRDQGVDLSRGLQTLSAHVPPATIQSQIDSYGGLNNFARAAIDHWHASYPGGYHWENTNIYSRIRGFWNNDSSSPELHQLLDRLAYRADQRWLAWQFVGVLNLEPYTHADVYDRRGWMRAWKPTGEQHDVYRQFLGIIQDEKIFPSPLIREHIKEGRTCTKGNQYLASLFIDKGLELHEVEAAVRKLKHWLVQKGVMHRISEP